MNRSHSGPPVRGSNTGRPVMVLLEALSRRSALRMIWELRDGRQMTFRALQEACETNPALLNTRLKEFRSMDIVEHEEGGYRLTHYGTTLARLLVPLNKWADTWASR